MALKILTLLSLLSTAVRAADYFGLDSGSLLNQTFGLSGKVYLVNSTLLQIPNFNLARSDSSRPLKLFFYFSTSSATSKVKRLYEVVSSNTGDYAKEIKNAKLDDGYQNAHLLVPIPESNTKWTYFGVVSEAEWFFLSAVQIDNKEAPKPYCCIRDPKQSNRGLIGSWYTVGAGPIEVIDAKTIRLPQFTFEGQKPPDGWVFTGRGAVARETGKKALIVSRDSKALHCPMRELYTGDKDIVAELAGDQTIYDIDYISVYCYAVGVDFGHVNFNIDPRQNPVPPRIPPIRDSPPPADIKGWERPRVALLPASLVELQATLGPPGGAKARAMRSICDNLDAVWYINGQLTPEIWVQRGVQYRINVLGGEQAFYITSEETGGYAHKPFSEQTVITNFAGERGDQKGSLCEWKPINDRRSGNPDGFDTFDAYRHFLNQQCENPRQPAKILWTPDENTPNTVYYASFFVFNMGGPIRVCNQIQGPANSPICIQ